MRFSRHYYVLVGVIFIVLSVLATVLPETAGNFVNLLAWLLVVAISGSLLATMWVYDVSNLYTMPWLNHDSFAGIYSILNVHAGYDESSAILKQKFPHARLVIADFYNPEKHTERSIRIARQAYKPYPGTLPISTSQVPLADGNVDLVCGFLWMHEIRDEVERIEFLKEMYRVLHSGGRAAVTEHLRNLPNFVVYNLGFLHFLPKRKWLAAFAAAGFYGREAGENNGICNYFYSPKGMTIHIQVIVWLLVVLALVHIFSPGTLIGKVSCKA
jgi:SAM-dependent methyltransferase